MASRMTAVLRVAIVDDEALARARIRRLLRREPDVRVAAECADGAAAVAAILEQAPDLVFLDVQMPELDGFGVLRALPADRLPEVVFVTAFDSYAVRAFEARARDYLLKPFTETRFHAAFERARAAIEGQSLGGRSTLVSLLEQVRATQQEIRLMVSPGEARWTDRLLLKEDGRVRVIPSAEVDYLEAAKNNVKVHVGPATHLLRETLTSLEQRLDPARFGRIHRSTLVNLERVAEIQPWFSGDGMVMLRNGAKLRMSRSYRHDFEARLSAASPRA